MTAAPSSCRFPFRPRVCSHDIDEIQLKIDARLEAAAAGKAGKETTAATINWQPTPKSIAAAEVSYRPTCPEESLKIREEPR